MIQSLPHWFVVAIGVYLLARNNLATDKKTCRTDIFGVKTRLGIMMMGSHPEINANPSI